jgi:phosphate transport system protein
MALIRSAYQDELDGVSQSLVDLTGMVTASMVKASKAVQTADLALAEEVIASDTKIDDYHRPPAAGGI